MRKWIFWVQIHSLTIQLTKDHPIFGVEKTIHNPISVPTFDPSPSEIFWAETVGKTPSAGDKLGQIGNCLKMRCLSKNSGELFLESAVPVN